MFEDVFLAVYLSLISGIILRGASSFAGVASSGGIALGFIIGLMVLGRWATPVLNRLLRISSNEVFVVVVFASLFLLAGLGETIHVAEFIGALLLGLLSAERLLKNRLGSKSFRIKQGLGILTGIKLPTLLLRGLNAYRRQADPTVRSIPLVASDPEAEFFDRLKDFRFADGASFDFRGERVRSVGCKSDTLANSNQRGDKGFITTYEVERTIAFVGKFKLDWIFVRLPALTDDNDDDQPHIFAPHFGRTLKSLNNAVADRISDHPPVMVDLPLEEPRPVRDKGRRAATRAT